MRKVHTSKMSADTSWCSEGLSGGDRNPGVEPVEYLWRPRGFYFYLVREIALAESSRETRKIYPRYFALSPAYPTLPSHPFCPIPPAPSPFAPACTSSGPFYSESPLSRALSRVFGRSCACGFSRSFSFSHNISRGTGERTVMAMSFTTREVVPFILVR